MASYDDILTNRKDNSRGNGYVSEEKFDKDAWAEKKKQEREKVYGMVDEVMGSFTQDSAKYQQYLDVQSQFSRYSPTNAMLISKQRPDATRVSDFDGWKEQGANIQKGAKGIYILEPGPEYEREDGGTGIHFNPKKVFDISQTTARRPPVQKQPDLRTRLAALVKASPVETYTSNQLPDGLNALYYPDDVQIGIRPGLDGETLYKAISAEVAHAILDSGDGHYERGDHAFEALSISYMLCKQNGIDTGSFDFFAAPDIFADRESQDIKEQLDTIKQAAGEISGKIGRELDRIREAERTDSAR